MVIAVFVCSLRSAESSAFSLAVVLEEDLQFRHWVFPYTSLVLKKDTRFINV